MLDQRPGLTVFEVEGKSAERLFAPEAGGHRWQRVPPTEKRGRKHTSTVTVAVLAAEQDAAPQLDERDIEWQATVGSGPGGQHKNKTASCVVMTHKPTGLTVRIENERSQHRNRVSALRLLSARLAERERNSKNAERATTRREQVGSGERGDKIRTVRLQDDRVVDHRTGKRMKASRYLRGHVSELH